MLTQSRNPFSSKIAVRAVLIMLLALLWSLVAVPSAYAYEDEELAFLTLINNHRTQNGLSAMTISNSLYNASELHSYDMGTRNYFGHNTPEGVTPWDRIRSAGYTYNTWLGENISAGYESAQSTFNAWRNSPGHNANMLSSNYRAIGIGRFYVPNSTYGWYWTTDFGGVAETVPPSDPQLLAKWNTLGGAPGGFTNEVQTTRGGKYQDFTNGRLYYNEATDVVYWVRGAILTKYDALGRETGAYGLPTSDEYDVSGVSGARESDFTNGRIYWGAGAGSYGISTGVIMTKYLARGGGPAVYGLPAGDEYSVASGRAQTMQRAILTWDGSSNTAYAVTGGIMGKYKILGGPAGPYGFAVNDEYDVTGVPGGRESDFTGGRIYWAAGTGTFGLQGAILTKYLEVPQGQSVGGPERNGLPTSDAYPAWSGWAQNMQRAIITWERSLDAHLVYGGIMGKYQMLGGPTGALHLATSDEFDVPGVTGARENDFQNGKVFWSATTGAHPVNGGIYIRYMAYCDAGTSNCGPTSRLGLPITDEYSIPLYGGGRRSQFQHGFVTWGAFYGTWVDVR